MEAYFKIDKGWTHTYIYYYYSDSRFIKEVIENKDATPGNLEKIKEDMKQKAENQK